MNKTLDPAVALRHKLNAETGRLTWKELTPFFARGTVIVVTESEDLIEVAAAFAEDDRARVEAWLADGRLARAEVPDAERWEAEQAAFWAVVVAPWVLVQQTETRRG